MQTFDPSFVLIAWPLPVHQRRLAPTPYPRSLDPSRIRRRMTARGSSQAPHFYLRSGSSRRALLPRCYACANGEREVGLQASLGAGGDRDRRGEWGGEQVYRASFQTGGHGRRGEAGDYAGRFFHRMARRAQVDHAMGRAVGHQSELGAGSAGRPVIWPRGGPMITTGNTHCCRDFPSHGDEHVGVRSARGSR